VLTPGLIDAHVHLVWSGGPDPAETVAREAEQLTTIRAAAHATAQLAAGITTVRDLGSNWDIAVSVARSIDRGHIRGPTVIAAGRTVIMTGGHDPFWGIFSDGPDAIRSAVRRQWSIGAGVIKVAATGGVYGRSEGEAIGQTELTREELAAASAEAHRLGLRVAAHALGEEGIRNAVLAGIDTIEHGAFLTEDIIDAMAKRGTVLCPTLAVYKTIADGGDGTIPAYATAKARTAVAAHRGSFVAAMEAGIPIIAGTDAGSCLTPHPALPAELELMCSYGMTPAQALRAATSEAARALGRADDLGRIAAGYRADLLVFDKNPLDDIGAVRDIATIFRAGERVGEGTGILLSARR
jgi:imidazolonepropionase-like amidohydrolase